MFANPERDTQIILKLLNKDDSLKWCFTVFNYHYSFAQFLAWYGKPINMKNGEVFIEVFYILFTFLAELPD